MLRSLTSEEVETLMNKKGVDKEIVEGFLRNVHHEKFLNHALSSLTFSMRMNKWDDFTVDAIRDGIYLADRSK